ncbi:MAG: ATP-grasp domain-containing protein [Leptolyngbyaceae cyanobacterium]
MKIFNHDITLYTHDHSPGIELYSGRALGATMPEDTIQLAQELANDWDAIATHYDQVGLKHSHNVIWDVSFEVIDQFPDHGISVYFFGDVINPQETYRQLFDQWNRDRRQLVEFVNSKNNFIQLSEELGIPVPKTLRFKNLAAAQASDEVMFPCFVKPAVSDHGVGIVRCADASALDAAWAQLDPDAQLQIQAEVQASTFLNLQYQIVDGVAQPLLVSEQILEGCRHKGNRYPASHEPWEKVAAFADWMSDRGMQDIFAVDVAVVSEASGVRYVAIECNPRFNGSSYPTLVAKRLHIPAWSNVDFSTELQSLKDLDLKDLAYDAATGKGVIVINWGTIQVGKIGVLIAGSPTEQTEFELELRHRL